MRLQVEQILTFHYQLLCTMIWFSIRDNCLPHHPLNISLTNMSIKLHWVKGTLQVSRSKTSMVSGKSLALSSAVYKKKINCLCQNSFQRDKRFFSLEQNILRRFYTPILCIYATDGLDCLHRLLLLKFDKQSASDRRDRCRFQKRTGHSKNWTKIIIHGRNPKNSTKVKYFCGQNCGLKFGQIFKMFVHICG